MKQVTQRLRDGRIEVLDVPPPGLTPHTVLVDIRSSLLSAGTERTKVETGRQNLLAKARSRPDQVRQVVEKAQRDGVRDTVNAVRTRLDQPSALGYSAAGVVLAVGERVPDLQPGDRVACAGAEHAVHAGIDRVPGNLCVPLPDGVSFDEGAFTTVGAIALQGVRQADVRLGERVAVIGLGLVGQLTGQILRAAGCGVVGVDVAAGAVESARRSGAIDTGYAREALTDKTLPADAAGCDAVIITAATSSDDPVTLAAHLCRDRGRVVVVGAVGMQIPRAPYYDKELDLRLSRSYGPGRYDTEYEERGLDYPIGYVRWTERRNMQAFLELIAARRIDVGSLVSERFDVDRAPDAYELLVTAKPSPLAVLLQYEAEPEVSPAAAPAPASREPVAPGAGLLGAGSFASGVLIPALRDAGWPLVAVASASGRSARGAQEQFGFERADTVEGVIGDERIGLVVVATRHASHAELASAALRAGRHVFVEKPPGLVAGELAGLREARAEGGGVLATGFNRRHAPLARRLRDHVAGRGLPIELLFRVNAGRLPAGHWLNDLDDGGGRLLGEGCHFVDFACWMAGALPERVECVMGAAPGEPLAAAQSFSVSLGFADGSVATILYGAGGASGLGKEYVEVHAGGRSGILDDFKSLELVSGRKSETHRGRGKDKGHRAQFQHLRALIEGRTAPEGPDSLDTMGVTLAALDAARGARPGDA